MIMLIGISSMYAIIGTTSFFPINSLKIKTLKSSFPKVLTDERSLSGEEALHMTEVSIW